LSIASGVLTYSRRVMETVGAKLVRLDLFSALKVILAQGLTVHFFTIIGVPVSTSQAVVGAVVGVGLVKGVNTVKCKTLFGIFTGWFPTPPLACFIAMCIDFALHLKYIPHQ